MNCNQMKTSLAKLIDESRLADSAKETLRAVLNTKKSEHPSCPDTYKKNPEKKESEAGFQRDLIHAGTSFLHDKSSTDWLDIELPVVFTQTPPGKKNSSRRRCLDLMGRIKTGKTDKLVMCELKYVPTQSKSYKSNNPVYALLELLIYYFHILENGDALDRQEIWHKPKNTEWCWADCRDCQNVILLVVGNRKYWEVWNNRNWNERIREPVKTIRDVFVNLDIRFYQTDHPFSDKETPSLEIPEKFKS